MGKKRLKTLTLHCFLLSVFRCHPGWTGNRCHVKEKPFPSTAAPEPEAPYLGNKRAHLHPRSCCKRLGSSVFISGCFFDRRCRLCGHRHRTAAARRRRRRLRSGQLQEKMLPIVSADQNIKTAAPCGCHFFGRVGGDDDGWMFSAASTGSRAR